MRVVDTSAWIEWLIKSPTGRLVDAQLPERNDWLVPTIVQLELHKWLYRSVDESRADRVLAFAQMCRVIALDTKTAFAAAELCALHRLATADAIVYASALANGADLLTCDAHFQGLANVVFIPKLAKST